MVEDEEIQNDKAILAEAISSVSVRKNSRGYNWDVKVYDKDIDKALADTIRIEEKLQAQYGVVE